MRYTSQWISLIASLGWGLTALAQTSPPAPITSRIANVTLYPGSATVERVARIPAGNQKLVFTCLPAGLDVQSLVLEADASVRIGELSALTEERSAAPACADTPLDARIRELEHQKARLLAEYEAQNLVNGYLKSLGHPDAGPGGVRNLSDPKSVAAMADALRRTSQDNLTRQNQTTDRQEEVDRLLAPLLAERERTLAGRARMMTVGATVAAQHDAEVRLRYQIKGPGWTPTYRAHLDSRNNSVRLERQALIAQASGEDWLGVQMRLSTGQPRQGTTGPQPRPWQIGIAQPVMEKSAPVAPAALAAPAPSAMPEARARLAAGAITPTFDVSVFENTFATEFKVPQAIDLPSNGQRITIALGSQDAKVQLLARTSPQYDASAWLVAELPQPEGVWPAGPLQLYRDSAFVGSDTLRIGGTRALNLSFGRDEQVTVQVDPSQDMQASAGFIGSRAQRSTTRAYTVENRHRTPVMLQVLEAAPVSVDEQVTIKTQFDPTPSALAWNEQPGLTLWSQTLEAGQKARFTARYEISYPKDARLQESR